MVNYGCDRCGYLTNRKSSYMTHLNRAIQCKITQNKPKLEGIVYISFNK